MTDFNSLNLAEPIVKAAAAEDYTVATPIQVKAIPEVLKGRDLLGIAQTGTGKTAAFAMPILDRISRTPKARRAKCARVLVLAPTRELVSQIAASFTTYGRFLNLSVVTVFGGVPAGNQIRKMANGVDVLVAAPGRLLDLIERRAISLAGVEVLVLDEADQMLDLGFIHALRRIIPMLPKERQTLLFSATMPKAIADLASRFLTDPIQVAVAPVATTVERVEQRAHLVPQARKPQLLSHTLRGESVERALVFTRTKHGADKVVRHLGAAGLEAMAIHGNKSQGQRERALKAFKAGDCRILIATDIAARGIDIDNVSHVINFDVPNVPEQYVHRIGRTARAGAAGLAISFVAEDERAYLRDIEKLVRLKIEVLPLPQGLSSEPHVSVPQPHHQPKQHRGRGGQQPARNRNQQNRHHRRGNAPRAAAQ